MGQADQALGNQSRNMLESNNFGAMLRQWRARTSPEYGRSAAMRSIGSTVPSRITYAFFRTVSMACSSVGARSARRSTASRM
ncbi:hypothetical protein AS200_08090 [Streptomyces sp. CdTB01]|nr:hypothetical protein AS200_08090 [Streptomyces sp. CdTB01]